VKLTPLGGALGLEVGGICLRDELSAAHIGELRRLLLEHLVLVFPGQFLTPGQHRAFARRFGELERHTEMPAVVEGTDREVVVVAPEYGVSAVWHFDYDADFFPSGLGSLNLVQAPARGGDTLFADLYRAYESLSEPMRALLDGLTAVHRNLGNRGRNRDEAEHALVGVHPETGRKVLVFSGHHVQRLAQLSPAESDALVAYLAAHSIRPEFTCRVRWSPGALCLWDNRATQHYAVADFEPPRLLHRVTMRAPLPRPLHAAAPRVA
jgi:taurine dioxygenase